MFQPYNNNGKLKESISLTEYFNYFKEHNKTNSVEFAPKKIAVNRQLLKQKEQLTYGNYNYTAFIEKVNLLNKYILEQLRSKGVSATLVENVSLTRPLLTFDYNAIYANGTYSYIHLENFLGDEVKCKNEYDDYYITIMPDRTAANNPLVRINFGRARMTSDVVHAWKDRSRQHRFETHKFDKQDDPQLFLSNNNDHDLTSVVEQDNSEINIDELVNIVTEYKEVIEKQSALLFKERKKTALKMARDLRPLNKALESSGFKVMPDHTNLDDFMNKAIDNELSYYTKCRYINGRVSINIEYQQSISRFVYKTDYVPDGRSYSAQNITDERTLHIDTFEQQIEYAVQISELIDKMRQS